MEAFVIARVLGTYSYAHWLLGPSLFAKGESPWISRAFVDINILSSIVFNSPFIVLIWSDDLFWLVHWHSRRCPFNHYNYIRAAGRLRSRHRLRGLRDSLSMATCGFLWKRCPLVDSSEEVGDRHRIQQSGWFPTWGNSSIDSWNYILDPHRSRWFTMWAVCPLFAIHPRILRFGVCLKFAEIRNSGLFFLI